MLTVDNDQSAWYAYLDHVAGVVPDENGPQAGISADCRVSDSTVFDNAMR